jgi:hypothetical protein
MGNTTLVNGRVYEPIQDYDILSQDLRNVTQLKEKLIIGSFIRAFSESMDVAEQTMWQMMTERSLATAKGINLDILGAIVGVPRVPPSLNDTDYLTKILTQINVRRSDSTPNTVLKIMKIVHNTSVAGNIFEHIHPKTGGVVVKIVTQNYVEGAASLMKQIAPAAIGSVAVLRDETISTNAWTPAEVGGGTDLIITNNNDSIVTDAAQALVALRGGGIVVDDGKGSSILAEEYVTNYQLGATKNTIDYDFWATKSQADYEFHVQREGMENTVGIFAEVQQLRAGNQEVEG